MNYAVYDIENPPEELGKLKTVCWWAVGERADFLKAQELGVQELLGKDGKNHQ